MADREFSATYFAAAAILVAALVGCERGELIELEQITYAMEVPEIMPSVITMPPIAQHRPAPDIEPRVAFTITIPPPAPAVEEPLPAIEDLPIAELASGDEPSEPPAEVPQLPIDGFPILGTVVAKGASERLTWNATETYSGASVPTPVVVVNGLLPGDSLCITAAVHGDEVNGIEIARRVLQDIDPESLSGTVIGVPIVNLQAFQAHSRYLPDRRDLNRFFPGNEYGSSASRIAHAFFQDVVLRCDRLIDLHTGSFKRTNLPQIRADLTDEDVMSFTQGFGATVILHSEGARGTLRRAAVDHGIPAVTLEAGGPLQVQEDAVKHGVKALQSVLDKLGMFDRRSLWGEPEPVYYQSRWVRANQGGILSSKAKLGKRVKPGDLLGTVTDPITNRYSEIHSPFEGRVLGMAVNQFVMPGYATFHIGLSGPAEAATSSNEIVPVDPHDDDALETVDAD